MLDEEKKLSRREFLKAAGLTMGGVAIGSLALHTACRSTDTPTSAMTSPTTNFLTSTVPPGVYVPPTGIPPMIGERYGCTSAVASDRWYNADHIWIKEWEDGKVVIGVTDKMQALMNAVNIVWFMFNEGVVVERDSVIAAVEARKLNIDIVAPVSGKILQLNHTLRAIPGYMNSHPYSEGWVMVMQLTCPQEMEDLIGPQYYTYLQAVNIPPTIPPKRS